MAKPLRLVFIRTIRGKKLLQSQLRLSGYGPRLSPEARCTIARRFAKPSDRYYVQAKLASDPVYSATAGALNNDHLPLFDVGCGLGILAHYLNATIGLKQYTGVDLDVRKVNAARSAAAKIEVNHAISLHVAHANKVTTLLGNVVLLDVLHYLSAADQRSLILSVSRNLANDGVLVIRSVLRDATWRFRATVLEEWFIRTVRWIPGKVAYFPSQTDIQGWLAEAGLDASVSPAFGNTPFNSYLISARRKRC